MENNTNKEKWIDAVLNSADGMMRAQPDAGMYERVAREITVTPAAAKVGGWRVTGWAAAAILLVAVNVGSVIYFDSHSKQAVNSNPGNSLASAMQSETTYNY